MKSEAHDRATSHVLPRAAAKPAIASPSAVDVPRTRAHRYVTLDAVRAAASPAAPDGKICGSSAAPQTFHPTRAEPSPPHDFSRFAAGAAEGVLTDGSDAAHHTHEGPSLRRGPDRAAPVHPGRRAPVRHRRVGDPHGRRRVVPPGRRRVPLHVVAERHEHRRPEVLPRPARLAGPRALGQADDRPRVGHDRRLGPRARLLRLGRGRRRLRGRAHLHPAPPDGGLQLAGLVQRRLRGAAAMQCVPTV